MDGEHPPIAAERLRLARRSGIARARRTSDQAALVFHQDRAGPKVYLHVGDFFVEDKFAVFDNVYLAIEVLPASRMAFFVDH
jgi:hypothetical protein